MTRLRAALSVLIASFAVGGCGATARHPIDYAARAYVGGQPVDLTAYAGEPVVLTSFASWCGECIGELPGLERYWRGHRRPTIVAVDLDDASGRRAAAALVGRNHLTMPIWVDAARRFVSVFDTPGTPTTVLLDRHHRVVRKWFGPVEFEGAAFRTAVAKVVAS